jgi:peptidyl-prolyl cis-trans isomerase D
MEAGARNDKKAEQLIAKFNDALGKTKDLQQLAGMLTSKVDTAVGISLSSFGIPYMGGEPEIVGTLWGYNAAGVTTKPIKGRTGVMVALIDGFNEPAPTTDYSQLKLQMANMMKSRAGYEVFNALERKADVKDYRGKFY